MKKYYANRKWRFAAFHRIAVNTFIILFLFTPFTLLANGYRTNSDTIKVLAIGNSFSQDAVDQYLHELGEAEGIILIIGNMVIGGCSLERHVQNIRNNAPAYAYRKIEKDGEKKVIKSMTIEKALTDEEWDYISVQQVSDLSGIYDSFKASLPELVNYIKERVGNETVLMMHQTWAYATDSNHTGFQNYDRNQMKMYISIVDAVKKAAELVGIKKIIPSGTAIQNARTSFIGDNMDKDGYHLNLTIGRYTAACTWFEALTHKNVTENSYSPEGMNQNYKEVAQTAAHKAILCPDKVTELTELKKSPINVKHINKL